MAATNPPIFEIRESPGKGKGLFATTDIAAGTLVIRDRSVITIEHLVKYGSPLPVFQLESVMHSWKALPMKLQSELADLHVPESSLMTQNFLKEFKMPLPGVSPRPDHPSEAELRRLATPILVFWANNFGSTDKSRQELFKLTSRVNHSCDPNMSYVIDKEGTMLCRASRAISRGEELTLTYVSTWKSRATRQSEYKECWDFVCECHRCSLADSLPSRLADIPGLPPFTTFKLADFARVEVTGEGVDLAESWRWMQLQIKRIEDARSSGNFQGLYFPYREMAEHLGAIVAGSRRLCFNKPSADYYKKAKNIAKEFYTTTPLYSDFCSEQQRTMDFMEMMGGHLVAKGLMTYDQ